MAARARSRYPGFDPRSVSGLKLWYRSDQGYEFGTGVKTWFDLTGNARNATQGTGANQPTITQNGQNGRPVFVLDGTAQCWGPVSVASMTACTIFTVVKINAVFASGTHDFLFAGGGGITPGVQITNSNVSLVNGGALNTGVAPTTVGFHYWTFVDAGASSLIRMDGTQLASGNDGAGTPDGITVGALTGGTRSASATFGEVLFYGNAVAAADIANIEAYLKLGWGL